MRKILGKDFFDRSARIVALEILGKYLVRKTDEGNVSLMINEVEIYDGIEDKASHSSRGITERNKVMWGDAGNLYIYFVYGMHNMLNVVVEKSGYPAAVLIRGGIAEDGREFNGPAKLTKYLKVEKSLNEKPAVKKSGLWFEDRGVVVKDSQIKKTPRIGVDYAGPVWSKKLYRFVVKK